MRCALRRWAWPTPPASAAPPRSFKGTRQLVAPESVLLHEPIERRAVDIGQPRRAGHVPSSTHHEALKILFLEMRDELVLGRVIGVTHDRGRHTIGRRMGDRVLVHGDVFRPGGPAWPPRTPPAFLYLFRLPGT